MNPLARDEQNRIVVASLVVVVTAMVPSMIAWHFPGSISRSVLMVIAGLGGAVAGRIVAAAPGERMRAHLGAMFGGVIAGLGGVYVATWWLEGRSSVNASEVALAVVIGAVPGVIIAGKLYLALRRPVERVPRASVR